MQYGLAVNCSSSPRIVSIQKPFLAGGIWLVGALFLTCLSTSFAQTNPRYLPLPGDVLLEGFRQESVGRKATDRLQTASSEARALFVAALEQGDPRWLGQAQAALAPWWTQTQLPSETLFVRALIKQGLHDFDDARLDLKRAIAAEPDRPEFWSWLFALDLVGANMAPAGATCQEIQSRFGSQEGDACLGVLHYRSGRARDGLVLLDRLAARSSDRSRSSADWLAFHRGEARRVLGSPQEGLAIWLAALKSGSGPHGLRLAAVELLNDLGRFAEADRLNDQKPRSDAMLVQAIRSARGLGQTEQAAALTRAFRARLERQMARGDLTNERPVIAFWLDIEQQPANALALARQAWATQREPADAVLYGRAALLLRDQPAARALMTWVKDTGFVDQSQKSLFDALAVLAGESLRP